MLPVLLAANAIALLVLWLLRTFVCEAGWFSMLLAYVPQFLFTLPSIVLLVWTLVSKRWGLALFQVSVTLLAAFALLGLTFHLSSAKPSLRILTLNIERGHHGLERVVRLVRQTNPDVFCMQESDLPPDEPIVAAIRVALPEYQVIASEGNLIGSRYRIISRRAVPLGQGKSLVEAIVDWNGHPLTIADVHLIAIFIDRYATERPSYIPEHLRDVGAKRDEQLELLLEYARSRTTPLILCGDFNAPAGTGFHSRLNSVLTDAFQSSGTGFGYTIPASFPLMRLDFVYCSPDLTPTSCWVPSEVVSDHRGVAAEFGSGR